MSSIESYRGGGLTMFAGRQADHAIARIQTGSSIRLARVDAEAEVMAGKTDAVNYVGGRAMHNVALLSQMEQQLAQAVPMASGRLATIGDITALAMSGIVSDTASRLHRI